MKVLLSSLAFLLLLTGFLARTAPPPDSTLQVLAYYVPSDDYPPEELPLDQLTHLIFSFTNVWELGNDTREEGSLLDAIDAVVGR